MIPLLRDQGLPKNCISSAPFELRGDFFAIQSKGDRG